MGLLTGLMLGGAAAAPWLLPRLPQIGRGAKAMWNLGKGAGTPAGRQAAVDAAKRTGQKGVDWYKTLPDRHPRTGKLRQAGINVGALAIPPMLWPDPSTEEGQDRPTTGGVSPGVDGRGVPIRNVGAYTQGGYADRLASDRESLLENLTMIQKQAMILGWVNPEGAKQHVKDSHKMLMLDAKSKNAAADAKLIDAAFKDGKTAPNAKALYNRLAPEIGPANAARVSGYTLEIEKTEAKAAADYAKTQPKLKDTFSKGMLALRTLQDAYMSGNQEEAIQQLALWLKSKQIEVPDDYKGYEKKDDADYYDIAAAMLSGAASQGVGQSSSEVYNIGLD